MSVRMTGMVGPCVRHLLRRADPHEVVLHVHDHERGPLGVEPERRLPVHVSDHPLHCRAARSDGPARCDVGRIRKQDVPSTGRRSGGGPEHPGIASGRARSRG